MEVDLIHPEAKYNVRSEDDARDIRDGPPASEALDSHLWAHTSPPPRPVYLTTSLPRTESEAEEDC